MTPKERAEFNIALNRLFNSDEEIRKQIAAQIREAVEEPTSEALKVRDHDVSLAVVNGKKMQAEAYEDAAKIAENELSEHLGKRVAQVIRARAKEVLGEK